MDSATKIKGIREQIFKAKDIKEEVVTVPEWGGVKIKLKSLTAAQSTEAYRKTPKDGKGDINAIQYGYYLFMKSAYDVESDQPLFDDSDLKALMEKNVGILTRLSQKVSVLCGLEDGAVENAQKN